MNNIIFWVQRHLGIQAHSLSICEKMLFTAVALLLFIAANFIVRNCMGLIALIASLVVVYFDEIKALFRPAPTLPLNNVAEASWYCICKAYDVLQNKVSVFRNLYADKVPIEGYGQYKQFLQYKCNPITIGTVPMIRFTFIILSNTAISTEDLLADKRMIQTIINDELNRKNVPYEVSPIWQEQDCLPTLYLLDISQFSRYLTMDFVWVDSSSKADFIHSREIPPEPASSEDQDF